MQKNFKKNILDIIFPIRCVSCGCYDYWLCHDCTENILLKKEQTCPLCKKSITPNGETCFACRPHTPLDGILVASFYRKDKEKTIIAKLVHYYKYRFVLGLKNPLGKILKKSLLESTLPLPDVIIPVPLHIRRLRWRGFNQSELLAHYLGKNILPNLEIPVLGNILIRNRYTKPQMHIRNRQERLTNLKDAFIFNDNLFKNDIIKEKNIFLVDDVITTGSTLIECAQVLKKAGAKKVYAIVLARQ
jgi:ComF family protein